MNRRFLQHTLFCYPSCLRCLTWLAWLATVTVACFMQSKSEWSGQLQKAMALGFDSGGSGPLTGLTLANDYASFKLAVLVEDIEKLKAILKLDSAFLTAYSVLLLCLAWRSASWLLRGGFLILILSTAVMDALENQRALVILDAFLQSVIPEPNGLWMASATKWTLFFATCLGLAVVEWWRPLTGGFKSGIRITICLLLGVGAITGLTWLIFRNAIIIENGFAFAMAALALFPLWLWNPDEPWSC